MISEATLAWAPGAGEMAAPGMTRRPVSEFERISSLSSSWMSDYGSDVEDIELELSKDRTKPHIVITLENDIRPLSWEYFERLVQFNVKVQNAELQFHAGTGGRGGGAAGRAVDPADGGGLHGAAVAPRAGRAAAQGAPPLPRHHQLHQPQQSPLLSPQPEVDLPGATL